VLPLPPDEELPLEPLPEVEPPFEPPELVFLVAVGFGVSVAVGVTEGAVVSIAVAVGVSVVVTVAAGSGVIVAVAVPVGSDVTEGAAVFTVCAFANIITARIITTATITRIIMFFFFIIFTSNLYIPDFMVFFQYAFSIDQYIGRFPESAGEFSLRLIPS
jgi:hypothetical protein